jgi:phosphoglycerol transferase MdoB-like AlkP superfamily enzyme
MDGNMFDRSAWWNTAGFQEIWFHDQFRQQALPDCPGAFIGTCDVDIARWIGRRLETEEGAPDFIYWMTLNSHLPVPVPSALSGAAPCLESLSLQPDTAPCSLYQLIENVLESVAKVAMAKFARPTVFIIVGDHAPPFDYESARSSFSRFEVPYVLLLPRASNPGRALLALFPPDHAALNPDHPAGR